MRKRITATVLIGTITIFTYWNINQEKKVQNTSSLILSNIEALATYEGSSVCDDVSGTGCWDGVWHPVYREKNW